MPEAVDRLLRVPDREQAPLGQQLDQLELHGIGVLELVDHDVRKARAIALAQLRLRAQQLERHQLEVLEVEPRALPLAALITRVVIAQEPVEQRVRALRSDLLAGGAKTAERLGVRLTDRGGERRAVAPGERRGLEVTGPGLLGRNPLGAASDALARGKHPRARRADRLELAH